LVYPSPAEVFVNLSRGSFEIGPDLFPFYGDTGGPRVPSSFDSGSTGAPGLYYFYAVCTLFKEPVGGPVAHQPFNQVVGRWFTRPAPYCVQLVATALPPDDPRGVLSPDDPCTGFFLSPITGWAFFGGQFVSLVTVEVARQLAPLPPPSEETTTTPPTQPGRTKPTNPPPPNPPATNPPPEETTTTTTLPCGFTHPCP
jgi:hypothetical protein